jgi:hypothetical protein
MAWKLSFLVAAASRRLHYVDAFQAVSAAGKTNVPLAKLMRAKEDFT